LQIDEIIRLVQMRVHDERTGVASGVPAANFRQRFDVDSLGALERCIRGYGPADYRQHHRDTADPDGETSDLAIYALPGRKRFRSLFRGSLVE
jgi:hypothetical protein